MNTVSMRGVARTLSVLRALNQYNGETVTFLSDRTSISRPALYRILETLITEGYVRRSADGERYELTALVRSLSDGYRDEDLVREAAMPQIETLQQEIIWPTDLATFRHDAMYLRETTRRASPLAIDGLAVGLRLPILRSATGRAFFAFCTDAERDAIVEVLKSSERPEDAVVHHPHFIANVIEITRKNGYGEREEDLYPKTSSIAVPVYCGDRVLACLNITFIASVMRPREAATRYLVVLKRAAESIGVTAEALKAKASAS
ncbi:IclR family transcriptional regulator C-terminal domain-containing protein [Caballeronia novacaledonica]|uniref:DNA-binding transcriptional regulator n=1 Tax=Caballeronia novacaledonica TaxID=1544861 RepID=A0AA37IGF6_9BURK|nr:IclR family transcriptional regulator C-terminal domain-containing protein [Caballeronia novacaledonica]GJH29361.1 DNA-binding transcriptional regulator [Caballeronia novacaledonica]